ncbi:MAG: methylated-DNA--[protein]-cysteine S-methyltransferase [Melioribacteraceae bacterium]
MKRLKKKIDFFDRVYKVVAKIPKGKVTTYGAIAEVCGIKSSARTVGWALNGAKETGLPCHRVVNRLGALTGKVHFGDIHLMEELLRSEGVEFEEKGYVIMKKYFWQPKKLTNSKRKSTSKSKRYKR